MRNLILGCALILMTYGSASAQSDSVLGYWREPEGSVIHVKQCGDAVCATLVEISKTAPARVDGKNPDSSLRSRTLCGLRIGDGFHMTSPALAENGSLYDPKSGKTYRGTMSSSGNQLKLRGYIGVPLFGRTETWTRTDAVTTCVR